MTEEGLQVGNQEKTEMNSDLINRYMDYISTVRRYSRRTAEIYMSSLEEFRAFSQVSGDGELLESLIPNIVRGYEVALLGKGLKSRTVNLHVSVLSGFCRFLVKEGILKSNPVRLVKRPRAEKRLPEFFREEDIAAYFMRTDAFASEIPDLTVGGYERRLRRAVVSTLYNTGIRRSELVRLRRGDVDFSRHVMRVTGKGDKMREIPLTSSFCQEISLYLHAVDTMAGGVSDTSSPLFVTAKGRPFYPELVDRIVKQELGEAGGFSGRKSPHVLRHTVATELLDDGADLNSIKEFLGHSSLAATQVYTHNSIEKLKHVYESAHPRAKNGGKNGD